MTILTLFFFVLVMAVGGLAIDIGRLYGVHGQMESYVDDLALASASQLDGQVFAVSRACFAATGDTKCSNQKNFAGPIGGTSLSFTDAPLAVSKLIFLSSLQSGGGPTPQPSDVVLCTYDAIARSWSSCPANLNAAAKYVAVSTVPMTVNYVVLPIANLIFGGSRMVNSSMIQMQATAGFVQETCGFTAMMICNPTELTAGGAFNVPIGRQIKLTDATGVNSTWAPGNFGFLDPGQFAAGPCGGLNGTKQIECMLAAVNPFTTCVASSGTVTQQPGNSTGLYDALNVRFDIWPNGNGRGYSPTDPNFAPAMNAQKGLCKISGNKCSYTTCPAPNSLTATSTLPSAIKTVPLPRDRWAGGTGVDCFTVDGQLNGSGSPIYPCGSGPIGVGLQNSDLLNYWNLAHPSDQNPSWLTAGTTRWDVYRHEIAATQQGNTADGIVNISNGELGAPNPICSSYTAPDNPNLDRRELFVAVVNCQAQNVHGSAPPPPQVLTFIKVFLTEPVGFDSSQTNFSTTTNKSVYAEVEGVLTPHDKSGLVHSLSVLYR
jgi:hypothetical protein